MPTTIEIVEFLEDFARRELIEDWDNTGFQVGSSDKKVKKVLLSLDFSKEVLALAKEKEVELIVNHHPFLFNGIFSVTDETYEGECIKELIKNDISLFNAHTNLDKTNGGVNDILADVIGLKNKEIFVETNDIDGEKFGFGKVGRVSEQGTRDFLDLLKKSLNVKDLVFFGDLDKKISKVAVSGGSGGSFVQDAIEKCVDIYVTGDIKYHEAELAVRNGLNLVDAGHFYTERIILPILKDLLENEFNDIEVLVHDSSIAERVIV